MTAFSSFKSALYKEGLIFFVLVDKEVGCSPEVESRGSIIIIDER